MATLYGGPVPTPGGAGGVPAAPVAVPIQRVDNLPPAPTQVVAAQPTGGTP